MWSIRRKIYGCEFLGIFPVFPIQNNGIQGISWKHSIFTIWFPIVMKIFPEIHIHKISVELITSLKSRFWSENFCRTKVIIHSSQEKYTEHLVRPIKIWKHFPTFFVNKNYRIRVTTYLWERDLLLTLWIWICESAGITFLGAVCKRKRGACTHTNRL